MKEFEEFLLWILNLKGLLLTIIMTAQDKLSR